MNTTTVLPTKDFFLLSSFFSGFNCSDQVEDLVIEQPSIFVDHQVRALEQDIEFITVPSQSVDLLNKRCIATPHETEELGELLTQEFGLDRLEGRRLINRGNSDISSGPTGRRHHLLYAGEQVEVLTTGHERNPDLAFDDHHPHAPTIELLHQRREIDRSTERRHSNDADTHRHCLVENDPVIDHDLPVLRNPPLDDDIGFEIREEVPCEVDSTVIVAEVELGAKVDRPTEGGGEVLMSTRIGVIQQSECVVVDVVPRLLESTTQHLTRGLGTTFASVLALGLDHEPIEIAESLEPIFTIVFVDNGHDLVVASTQVLDKGLCHLRIQNIDREIDESHASTAPRRNRKFVHAERIGKGDLDLGGIADETKQRGRGEDAVHAVDGHDEINGSEGRENGPGHFGLQ